MRQVLGPGALGRPRGMGWRGRWEGGSGWGTHVNPWLILVIVWQKPLQYCKVISLQLIKIIGEKIAQSKIKCSLFLKKKKKKKKKRKKKLNFELKKIMVIIATVWLSLASFLLLLTFPLVHHFTLNISL